MDDRQEQEINLPSSVVVCPICSHNLANLSLLNAHLDNSHSTTSSPLLSWLRQTHSKILTPLSKVASSLPTLRQLTLPAQHVNSNMQILREVHGRGEDGFNADDYISRDAWIISDEAVCMEPKCAKSLGVIHGKVNCRK